MKSKGLYFENVALRWLKAKGLKMVAKNYQSRAGEIDLIMLDQESLCFIEVKYRNNRAFGGAAHSITPSKRKKIIQTALSFVSRQPRYQQHPLRFDALLIEPGATSDHQVDWIKDAFSAEGY